MSRLRIAVLVCLLLALVLLGIDFVLVAFFGGFHVTLGDTHIRSTTIELPAAGLLITMLLAVLIAGTPADALLLCGALSVAAVLGEIGLRLIDHPLSRASIDFNRWYEPSDLYGHRLVPNFQGLGPLRVPVRVNAEGFRDSGHELAKDEGTIRILALGDSFTFGWGVAEHETFVKQLERRIGYATGVHAETINMGVPGWGLNQYYLSLLSLAPIYRRSLCARPGAALLFHR